MEQLTFGFPEFQTEAIQQLEPMLAAARRFTQIGRDMLKIPVSNQLPDVAKQITLSVANSMESVLLLVTNGCGIDALRISRTMFEAAVTLHYLDSHPELVQDFVDYMWVIRKKHNDYRLTLPTEKVKPLPPETVAEMEANYQRVKHRFVDRKGRVRNSWCKANLKDMSKEVKAESMYGGLYPFGSSMTHTDILAVVAGAGGSNDVESVPSELNVTFALQTAVVSFAMTLMAFDQIAALGRSDELEAAFNNFKNVPESADQPRQISETEVAVCAYYLWERRGRQFGSPEVDWFEAERRLNSRR
jgi:hypothetical protein